MRSILALLLLCPSLLLAACSEPARGRVVIIGVDGASMELLGPMMKDGRLPHFSELATGGASGLIRSETPPLSPRIWTTVATGKVPERHGIEGWVYEDRTGSIRLYESGHRNGAALWNIVSDAGRQVATVNWLMTYPPEDVNGVVVTDHALPGEAVTRRTFGNRFANMSYKRGLDDAGTVEAPTIHPTSREDRLYSQLVIPDPLTLPNPFDTNQALKGVALLLKLSHFYWNDQRAARLALAIDEDIRPDLMMVLMQGVDRVSHSLWGTLQPEPIEDLTPEKHRAAGDTMRRYYEIADSLVGALLARYDENDLVIVLSDHGFEYIPGRAAHKYGGVHETPAASAGVLFMRGPGIPRGHRIEGLSVLDITPTVLAWMGLPVARDMSGRVAPFLDREVTFTDTYDGLEIERIGASGTRTEAAILDQLEALGYVDRSEPDEGESPR